MAGLCPDRLRLASASSQWIDRRLAACSHLAELQRSNPINQQIEERLVELLPSAAAAGRRSYAA
jgi:hypothetical protein